MRTKKPVIALYPSYDPEGKRQNVMMRYVHAVERAGGAPFLLPLSADEDVIESMVELCDGMVFTGGDDLHPRHYGACLHEGCGDLCPERDEGEVPFARAYLKTKKPFLAVCRGIQLINVMYGGTLYQDINLERGRGLTHRQPPPYTVGSHGVRLVKDGFIARLLGKDELWVNSMHHQAVKEIGKGLSLEGKATDGVIEALVATDRPFGVSVQWHPECLVATDDASLRLFTALVEEAKK
ncbi:MAG: gamma-glutamyl-gamma-aminobutyrate hydrolase family protein [Clostridia bacterium]|nr:gamma-glutamyl-gamma-aminobutyrate hydrolase family protein [Clostridia bacterium]